MINLNHELEGEEADEFLALSKFSAKIGKNLSLIQGAGGNTSLKTGSRMYVKASGMWLSDALQKSVFCDVSLNLLDEFDFQTGSVEQISKAIVNSARPDLRPSIETSLHLAMPHRVVIHLHSIDVLAFAVLRGGFEELTPRLKGLAWSWIPYCRPGFPLTLSVLKHLQDETLDYLLLANHGLVIGAESVEQAERRLDEILSRISRPIKENLEKRRPSFSARQRSFMSKCGFQPATHSVTHLLAFDHFMYNLAKIGVLYPDQAVFLGPEIAAVDAGNNIDDVNKSWQNRYKFTPTYFILENAGVIVSQSANPSVEEQLAGHALLLAKLNESDQLSILSHKDVAELLDWDAEKYRQKAK